MFCTKCGNALVEGDLFCGKCGNRVQTEAPAAEKAEQGRQANPAASAGKIPVQGESQKTAEHSDKTAEADKPTAVAAMPATSGRRSVRSGKSSLRPGIKLPPKRTVRLAPQNPASRSLAINGLCRYCGTRLSDSDTICPGCGATGVAAACLKPKPTVAPEVLRAGKIGQNLGEETMAFSSMMGLTCFSSGGCLSALVILINPLFWIQWLYRQKARDALEAGNLDEAEKHKKTATLFGILGWVLFFAVSVLGINYLVVSSK